MAKTNLRLVTPVETTGALMAPDSFGLDFDLLDEVTSPKLRRKYKPEIWIHIKYLPSGLRACAEKIKALATIKARKLNFKRPSLHVIYAAAVYGGLQQIKSNEDLTYIAELPDTVYSMDGDIDIDYTVLIVDTMRTLYLGTGDDTGRGKMQTVKLSESLKYSLEEFANSLDISMYRLAMFCMRIVFAEQMELPVSMRLESQRIVDRCLCRAARQAQMARVMVENLKA